MMLLFKRLEIALITLLSVFAPVKEVLFTTFIIVMVDALLGLIASKKAGRPITSRGFKTTSIKLTLYELAICLAHLVSVYLTGEDVPALKIVSSMIGITELKSCLESMNEISGGSFMRAIIDALGSRSSIHPPDKND